MLRDSFTHAHEDEAARSLREVQVDADRLIEAVQGAVAADARLLDEKERAEIEVATNALRVARNGTDVQGIRQAISVLEVATREFAQRRMDASVRKALSGHRVDEFDTSA